MSDFDAGLGAGRLVPGRSERDRSLLRGGDERVCVSSEHFLMLSSIIMGLRSAVIKLDLILL